MLRKAAERVLGRILPKGSRIFYFDLIPGQIVICPDAAYHMLLERRTRAFKASGHAGWLKCIYCKQYDRPQKLTVPRSKKNRHIIRETWAYHIKCAAKNRAKYVR